MDLNGPVKLAGFEGFNISNINKILLHFAIVFKIFKSFVNGLLDRTPETKNGFKHFSLQNLETFLVYFANF